jgi:hypothetical protein
MSGVYTVTEDGCLAAETFAIRYALAEVTNPEDRRLVRTAALALAQGPLPLAPAACLYEALGP